MKYHCLVAAEQALTGERVAKALERVAHHSIRLLLGPPGVALGRKGRGATLPEVPRITVKIFLGTRWYGHYY